MRIGLCKLSGTSSERVFFLLLTSLLAFPEILFASAYQQEDPPDTAHTAVTLGLHGHYGFIIPHASEVRGIATSNPWGLEADISFHFTDKKAWQYLQAYSRLGASFAYYNFDNPDILGNAYSFLLFAEPFLSAEKKFSFSFRLGIGISYLDNVYDPISNPENLFYSTPISFPLVANFMGNYRIGKHFLLRAGATYSHISNGGVRQPNKGINYPTITTGLNYTLRSTNFPDRHPEEGFSEGEKRDFSIALVGGIKDSRVREERQLPLLGIAAYVSQRIGRISAVLVGAEWIGDYSIREQIRENEQDRGFFRGGLLAGHELRIGRIRFSQQLGVYLYAPFPARDPVYQRYGLEYHTAKKIFFGVNLKAHRHVADFFDARLGLNF